MAVTEGVIRAVCQALPASAFPSRGAASMPYAEAMARLRHRPAGHAVRAWSCKDITELAGPASSRSSPTWSPPAASSRACRPGRGRVHAQGNRRTTALLRRDFGAKGLAWSKLDAGGQLDGPLAKFFTGQKLADLLATMKAAHDGDACCSSPTSLRHEQQGPGRPAQPAGQAAEAVQGRQLGLVLGGRLPAAGMVRGGEALGGLHHPFTSPMAEDLARLETDPGTVQAGPTTSCSTASSWAAAASVSTTPRCSGRSSGAEHRRRGGPAEVRLPAGRPAATARRRTAASPWAWTARDAHARPRQPPRRHRLPQDRQRHLPDDRGAVTRRRQTVGGAGYSDHREAEEVGWATIFDFRFSIERRMRDSGLGRG